MTSDVFNKSTDILSTAASIPKTDVVHICILHKALVKFGTLYHWSDTSLLLLTILSNAQHNGVQPMMTYSRYLTKTFHRIYHWSTLGEKIKLDCVFKHSCVILDYNFNLHFPYHRCQANLYIAISLKSVPAVDQILRHDNDNSPHHTCWHRMAG